ALEDAGRILGEIVERAALEHEEPAVDHAVVGLRLLAELADALAAHAPLPEPRRRVHARHGGERALSFVKREEAAQIDVAHAVAVGEHEAIAGEIPRRLLHAGAGGGRVARVDERDAPAVLAVPFVEADRLAAS